MANRFSRTLVALLILAAIAGTASAQYGSRCDGGYRPICPPTPPICPPVDPIYPPVDPIYPPVDPPISNSYFLGVYVSKVRVEAYGNGRPVPGNPESGPLRAGGAQTFVAPGYGQDVYGLRINRIVANSPAFHAGLEPGDILLDGNGFPMDSEADLRHAINTSEGMLEMKVLDARTGRLVWVVAQTDAQSSGPLAISRQRTPERQLPLDVPSTSRQSSRRQGGSNVQLLETARNTLSSLRSLRRAPIRRGQR